MSRRDRITAKKGRRAPGNKNVNPKLSAYQKEQKRNRMANQPPIELLRRSPTGNALNDVPRSARKIFEFMQKAKENREKNKYNKNKDRSNNSNNNSDQQQQQQAQAQQQQEVSTESNTSEKQRKNMPNYLKNATSINTQLGLDATSLTSASSNRVRLNILEKKAKLQMKKKQKRRAKRQQLNKNKLNSLMALEGGASNAAIQKKNVESGNLTRKEKQSIKQKEERKQFREEERRQREKEENAINNAGEEDGNDGETEFPQDYDSAAAASNNNNNNFDDAEEGGDNDLLDDDDEEEQDEVDAAAAAFIKNTTSNSSKNKQQQQDSSSAEKISIKKNKKIKKQKNELDPEEKLELQNYKKTSKKDFESLETMDNFVRFGDRVDAPPVFDVVPSATLAAALDRRTSKTKVDKKKQPQMHDDAAVKAFRLFELGGQTSLSETAQKQLHGRGFIGEDNNQNNQNQNQGQTGDAFFERKVSGSKLETKEDFEALRKKVLDNYNKYHPRSFGKDRTYTPLL